MTTMMSLMLMLLFAAHTSNGHLDSTLTIVVRANATYGNNEYLFVDGPKHEKLIDEHGDAYFIYDYSLLTQSNYYTNIYLTWFINSTEIAYGVYGYYDQSHFWQRITSDYVVSVTKENHDQRFELIGPSTIVITTLYDCTLDARYPCTVLTLPIPSAYIVHDHNIVDIVVKADAAFKNDVELKCPSLFSGVMRGIRTDSGDTHYFLGYIQEPQDVTWCVGKRRVAYGTYDHKPPVTNKNSDQRVEFIGPNTIVITQLYKLPLLDTVLCD